MFENKTIVHKYITYCKTVVIPPGFGDFLRGTLYLYQLSQKLGLELIIDFSSHPIGKWIVQQHRYNLEHIQDSDTREFFNENMCMTEKYIQDNVSPILICHNWPLRPLDLLTKLYLQQIITFNESFHNEIKDELKRLKFPEKYCVIHVRTGDRNTYTISDNMEQYIINHIIPKWGNNIIVNV